MYLPLKFYKTLYYTIYYLKKKQKTKPVYFTSLLSSENATHTFILEQNAYGFEKQILCVLYKIFVSKKSTKLIKK